MKKTVAIPARFLDPATKTVKAGLDLQTLQALQDYDPLDMTPEEVIAREAEIASLTATLAELSKYGEVDMTPDEIQDYNDRIAAEAATLPARLNNHLDSSRYAKEQGGITVGGVDILTRDRDKTLITGKIMEVMVLNLPDTDTFKFTLNGEEILMTVGQIKMIGVEIARHVQRTIDAASSVRPSIANGTLTTEQEVEDAFATTLAALQD